MNQKYRFVWLQRVLLCSILSCFTTANYALTKIVPLSGPENPKQSAAVTRLIRVLQKQGVQVESTDRLRIVMRTDKLFRFPTNTHLTRGGYPLLKVVAKLLQNYTGYCIIVTAYSDHVGSPVQKLQNTEAKAQSVAAYLWSCGIPFGTMRIVGGADTQPVADNDTPQGSAANRRIEITIG